MIGAIIALIVVLGGGVSVAAQSSLPGSVLYPWKVNVNEEAQASLKFSAQAKADFEAARAQERLKEAEELSVKSSVDAQTQATIEANFKAFADRAQARIAALTDTDAQAAADIASHFETALVAHEKVLARLNADVSTKDEMKDLEAQVDRELSDTVKARMDAEARLKAQDHGPLIQAAAQGKLTAAANVIAEVNTFIALKKDQLGVDATAKAQAKLAIAQNLLVQANAKLAAGDYVGAFILGNQVIRTAQGAKLLIETQGDLDVDLHLDGTAEKSEGSEPRTDGLRESEGSSANVRVDVHMGF